MRRTALSLVASLLTACTAASGPTDASTPSDGGAALWPVGATRVDATRGVGFAPELCPDGGTSLRDSLWSLSLPDGALTFARCGAVLSDRTLTAAELASFDTAMRGLSLPSRPACGADKPAFALALTTPRGAQAPTRTASTRAMARLASSTWTTSTRCSPCFPIFHVKYREKLGRPLGV